MFVVVLAAKSSCKFSRSVCQIGVVLRLMSLVVRSLKDQYAKFLVYVVKPYISSVLKGS